MVRRAVLKDSGSTKWSDDQILDALGWALDTFAIHTAAPSTVTWEVGTTQAVAYTLPDNVFDDPMETALIRYRRTSDDVYEMLAPISIMLGAKWTGVTPDDHTTPRGWWVWPDTTLNLRFKPGQDTTLEMLYFARYTKPTTDTDVVEIPRWAEGPVAVLTGAFCQVSEGVFSANLRQHSTIPDKGTPEDNPLAKETNHLFDLYNRMVNQHPAQDRRNHWAKARTLK